MSMTQEKMYMNVDDVCAVLGVSKALPRRFSSLASTFFHTTSAAFALQHKPAKIADKNNFFIFLNN